MKDEYYMQQALNLATATKGQTAPNPVVGAVIVNNGEIVGLGAHLKAGKEHAEVHAINMAGSKTHGATIYVTLEPCNHHGKTPPCTEAIIQAGIKEVVIASVDSNPLVSGSGIDRLQEAGIQVRTGILQEQANVLNEAFFHYIETGKPFVTIKQAVTLDGKTATRTGHSKWITSEASRRDVHRDRGLHDAILVGINTILADDASLTNRDGENSHQPIRIILDTRLRMPIDRKVIQDGLSPTWIITGSEVTDSQLEPFKQDHVEIIRLSQPNIDLDELLRVLGERNITSLYVEGGHQVHTSFLKTGNVNRFITYLSPKIVGGPSAVGMFAELNINQMQDSYPLVFEKVEQLGNEIKIVSKPIRR